MCNLRVKNVCVYFILSCCMLSRFSHLLLFATLWTVAHQAPVSIGFSRQEYWSELPCPPPGDFPDPGIEPASLTSPVLAGRFFTTSSTKNMYRFDFVRCCEIGLQNDYICWHSHQQHRRQRGLWTQKVWVKSWVPLKLFSVPIRNLVMPWLQEGHVKCAAQRGLPQHHCPTFSTSPTELCLAVLPELS